MSLFGKMKMGAVALGLIGGPVAAMECTFTSECLEGEGCAESGYALSLGQGEAPDATLQSEGGQFALMIANEKISDVTGDFVVLPLARRDGDRAWFGFSDAGSHLLTVAPEGAARYTAHFTGAEFSITYLGRCEDTQ